MKFHRKLLVLQSFIKIIYFSRSGPDGYEISNFWNFENYQVNDERFLVKLTKWDVDWKDTGTHVIFAHNSEKIEIFAFDVLVEGTIG